MRVALVSTYELGHQPLGVASPAAALLRAGHQVRACDLSVTPLDRDVLDWADVVAFSVPMHTAMRLARIAITEVRRARPDVAVWLYGLYAGLDGAVGTPAVADLRLAGEYEGDLVDAVAAMQGSTDPPRGTRVSLGRGRFALPARHLLPPLDSYARLAAHGELYLAGYTEASHGCAHRCRHCPVPVVYDGRTRLVSVDSVVADVAQLVEMGSRHITYGDPDFLNGPHHARRVVDAVHASFPALTFDVTVKVEHVLRHRTLWPALAQAGCVFVVSAFESVNDAVLAHLDKGHTVADEAEAVAVLRAAGIEPRPSLVPFTPWTTEAEVVELFDLVEAWDLVGNVDPVQFAIRLLVPPGSLLLASGALDGMLDGYDPAQLGWRWRATDPRLDVLAAELAALSEQAGAEGWPAAHSMARAKATVADTLGRRHVKSRRSRPDAALRSPMAPDERPRLTESWFCCAEPTATQLSGMRAWVPAAVTS